MAVSVNLDQLLMKQYEDSSPSELLDAPVTALAGISEGDADHLKKAFNIDTVRDLGTSKHFRAAQLIVDIAKADDD